MRIFFVLLAIFKDTLSANMLTTELSTTDPNFAQLFAPLKSTTTGSLLECAAWLETTTTNPVKSSRASAMVYHASNSTCVLGRAPAYVDAYTNSGDPEDPIHVHFLAGIPEASAMNSDTWFYALFNDEESEAFCHPNFIGAWRAGFTPNWSGLTYSINSPIVTYGGTYATTLNQNYFRYSAPSTTTFTELTILLWYSATAVQSACLVSLCNGNTPGLGFYTGGTRALTTDINSGSWTQPSNNGIWSLGAWNYQGLTFSKVSQKYAFWVNGTTNGYNSASAAPSIPSFDNICIGALCGGSYPVAATLASVEIYNKELNQTQIQAAMAKSFTGRTMTGMLPPT